jgi:hypothetical protein
MKKSAWIALLVLSALAAVFFVIRDEPKTAVQAPMTIEPVKHMNRVEIAPPDSAESGELIVLERRDGTWQMTRPHRSALNSTATAKLGTLFAKEIRTDDLRLSSEKKAEYGIDEASVVELSAYSEGSDTAALELEIGEEITVAQTGARRTYVREAGEDGIYRAQAALGDFVRLPAADLRSKSMVELDPVAFMDVTITHANGAETRIAREKNDWELVAPQVGAEVMNELDQTAVERLVNALASVRATGFADDKKPAEVGLEPAQVSVRIETVDGKSHRLEIGNEIDGGKFYARFDDGAAFTVAKSVADRISLKAGALLKQNKAAKAQRDKK